VYRAVVQAGLKSGRLAAALEAVAASSRRLSQARRMIAAGIIYPLLVFLVGWGLFVFYTVKLAGSFLQVVDDFGLPGRGFFAMLSEWGQTAGYWGPAAPVAILLLAGLWWASSGRASLAEPGMAGALLGWLPGMRRMLRNYQVATFADLLALLAEHGVPLAEAMVLAADAIGGRRLKDAAGQIAVAVQRGESLAPNTPGMGQLPPLLVWLMSRGQADGSLPSALRQAAEIYHQRAFYQSEALRVFTPVFLTLVIGGGITFSYALLVLGSWITILKGLSYVS
jgi:general secretion pathway protein F